LIFIFTVVRSVAAMTGLPHSIESRVQVRSGYSDAILPRCRTERRVRHVSSAVLPCARVPYRILAASLVGTTIEFFDFYIYATAAVLVFPTLFFPRADHGTQQLQSFATFALAFFARPLGSALFGHFGDRVGRKATLVTALLTMGLSTVLIGLLPTYASIGLAAPALLALCRFGQGLGLGGEWGGAILLATENAPPGYANRYGCFPQLGAPLGFIAAGGAFLLISTRVGDAGLLRGGWRWPFLASALLVAVGLYVRLQLTETPAFERSAARGELVRVPMFEVMRRHGATLILGTLATATTFAIFYLMTVFALAWATTVLGFRRADFLELQLIGVLFFGLLIPISATIADRIGARRMLLAATVAIVALGFSFAPLFGAHDLRRVGVFLALGFSCTGLTYGPLGNALAELFPTAVRYTGASLTFNLAGILGASLAPLIADRLARAHGVGAAGLYLSGLGLCTLVALLLLARRHPAMPPRPEAGAARIRAAS
jgi:MFS family permease